MYTQELGQEEELAAVKSEIMRERQRRVVCRFRSGNWL